MKTPFIRTFVNKSIAPFPVYNKYKHVPVLKLLCFIFSPFSIITLPSLTIALQPSGMVKLSPHCNSTFIILLFIYSFYVSFSSYLRRVLTLHVIYSFCCIDNYNQSFPHDLNAQEWYILFLILPYINLLIQNYTLPPTDYSPTYLCHWFYQLSLRRLFEEKRKI